MKFTDFISSNAIVVDLKSTSKKEVVREMAQALQAADNFDDETRERVVEAVLNREDLGPTSVGRGIAVPHAKCVGVDRLVGLIAISREGVDFASLDSQPVYLFFMIVSPFERPGDHLRALEHITLRLKNEEFVEELKGASDASVAYALLQKVDSSSVEA